MICAQKGCRPHPSACTHKERGWPFLASGWLSNAELLEKAERSPLSSSLPAFDASANTETHAGVNPAYCKLKVSPFTDVAFPKRAVEVPRNCTLRHVVRQLLGSRNGSQRGKAGLVFACEWPSNSVKLFWMDPIVAPTCLSPVRPFARGV